MSQRKFSMKVWAIVTAIVCVFCMAGCTHKDPAPTPSGWQAGEYTLETAYERAAELGYTGTLEEFIASIRGRDGVDGKDGKDGVDGIDGVDGKDGKNGKDGKDGVDGKDGKDGVGIQVVTVISNELVVIDTNGKTLLQMKLPLCKHRYGDSVMGLAPSCTAAGYKYAVCSICGKKEYEVLSPSGHDWDDGIVVFAPECVRNGLRYYTCRTCGDTRVEILYATGVHVFENDTCIYCRKARVQALDEMYNGTYGYDYFRTLENGDKLCALYDDLHTRAMQFHNGADEDATTDDERANGAYILGAFDYTAYGLTTEEAAAVWKTYLDDKPLYYWLSKTLAVYGEYIIPEVDPEYAQGEVRAAYNEKLYKMLDEYAQIAAGESAYRVALAYHDTIIRGIDYAYKEDDRTPEDAAWAHNIVGVFEGKGAVCEGYARAFQLLLNMRGIENVVVTGQSRRQSHAWNLVRLNDGNWYWYDLTWDDTPSTYWGISYTNTCVLDGDFTNSHTADSPSEFGANFLYALPPRATADYDGTEIKRGDIFSYGDAEYVVEGYDTVSLSQIHADGDFVVPATVSYRGRTFTVVSFMHYEHGKPSIESLFPYTSKVTSVSIPSTVMFINDGMFRGATETLANIYVDEENSRFASQDGVLFSKTLYTLISYPRANTRTTYAIPDETHIIAEYAFSGRDNSLPLQSLHVGKNLLYVGVPNWGDGYPLEGGVRNTINGAWHDILQVMGGEKELIIDEENPYLTIEDGVLYDDTQGIVHVALQGVETVTLPATVQQVDHSAFADCKNLRNVVFTSEDVYLSSSLFENCTNLREVVLPTKARKIPINMFRNCASLEGIVLPDTVTEIGMDAFDGCTSLKRIHIPAHVCQIGQSVLRGCTSLQEITVAPENEYYIATDKCLIEKATKKLIQGFADSVIPDDGSVTVIGDGAFWLFTTAAEMIAIPEGVTTIEDSAFMCASLKALVLPLSLEYVGIQLLNKDVKIYYKGTEDAWDALHGSGAIDVAPDALYFFSEARPADDGNYWHYVNGVATPW